MEKTKTNRNKEEILTAMQHANVLIGLHIYRDSAPSDRALRRLKKVVRAHWGASAITVTPSILETRYRIDVKLRSPIDVADDRLNLEAALLEEEVGKGAFLVVEERTIGRWQQESIKNIDLGGTHNES